MMCRLAEHGVPRCGVQGHGWCERVLVQRAGAGAACSRQGRGGARGRARPWPRTWPACARTSSTARLRGLKETWVAGPKKVLTLGLLSTASGRSRRRRRGGSGARWTWRTRVGRRRAQGRWLFSSSLLVGDDDSGRSGAPGATSLTRMQGSWGRRAIRAPVHGGGADLPGDAGQSGGGEMGSRRSRARFFWGPPSG